MVYTRPDILTVINLSKTFVRPISSYETHAIKEYMFVALDPSGAVALPPYDGFFPVYMVVSASTDEPATEAAGSVALLYGKFRIVTDQIETPVSPGDPVIAGVNGKLKKLDKTVYPGVKTAIGWVEQVIDETRPLVVVNVRPTYIP